MVHGFQDTTDTKQVFDCNINIFIAKYIILYLYHLVYGDVFIIKSPFVWKSALIYF